jgi:hypothetical protein
MESFNNGSFLNNMQAEGIQFNNPSSRLFLKPCKIFFKQLLNKF